MKTNKAGIIYEPYANDGVAFPGDSTGAVEGQRVCRFWMARRVFEQPDWTKPYQQYTDTPSGTFWCTAVAEQGEREAFSVSVGTPYEHVKWFRAAPPSIARSPAVPTRHAAHCHRRSSPPAGRRPAGQVLECTPSC